MIAANIIDPLIHWRGILLDGHTRKAIADKHGIGYRTTEIVLPDRAAAIEWVIRHQFGRRNLTAMQRAELALKLKPVVAETRHPGGRPKNGDEGGTDEKPLKKGPKKHTQNSEYVSGDRNARTTDALVASAAGVSRDTISKAETVLNKGTEALKDAARVGTLSVSAAAVAARLPAEQQDAIAAGVSRDTIAKAAKQRSLSNLEKGRNHKKSLISSECRNRALPEMPLGRGCSRELGRRRSRRSSVRPHPRQVLGARPRPRQRCTAGGMRDIAEIAREAYDLGVAMARERTRRMQPPRSPG